MTTTNCSKDLEKLNEDDMSKALRYGGDGSNSSDDSDGSEDSSTDSSTDSEDSSNGSSSKDKND